MRAAAAGADTARCPGKARPDEILCGGATADPACRMLLAWLLLFPLRLILIPSLRSRGAIIAIQTVNE